ncbi:MAG: ion transporter [Kiritimatiellaeota bacterium]|nr:ion transporter [Kiritimatiellota bacterium]
MDIKRRIYRIIQPHKKDDTPSALFDWFIAFLVILDVSTTILDTLVLPGRVVFCFWVLEIFTVAVFTVEYMLRVWTADLLCSKTTPFKARLKNALTFVMIVDFIAVAPFYLHFLLPINLHLLRAFRLLRIFRLLKIKHYIKTLSQVSSVLRQKASQLFISLFILFILMIVASVLMYTAEHEAQPDVFKNALSGLWWAVITLTTVGYGDIYPITVLGKIIGSFFSIFSIALIAIPTGIISAGFIENFHEKKTNKDKRFCPYCGEKLDG